MRFKRFPIGGFDSVAALFPADQRRGIYVLEFTNGEQYVGQALNVVTRFSNHRHGSRHHKAWTDIEAIQFFPVPEDHLTPIEFEHIARLRSQGIELRNKTGNFGHLQPSRLDEVIPVEDQEHWVLGRGNYGVSTFDFGVPEGTSKLCTKLKDRDSELLARIFGDLRYAFTDLIPNAAELESLYWTLSDYPSTAGGRFATLNLGVLEFVVHPRTKLSANNGKDEHFVFINFPEGTLVPENEWEPFAEFRCGGELEGCFCVCVEYELTRADALYIPVGRLQETLDQIPELVEAARAFAIELMRQNQSNLFRRWHSRTLVGEVMTSQQGQLPAALS
ncbi:GIY-YIG nuclease family protein [Corynebacterium epidermidicanis]|uniref:GIY-YIG domain-containing protein n=1 Tax=Corynebacterium epidermidicanis TaxID=1050174 RepID=A0A0G3GT69_9CORY|nr:GIY-YIG nuclease family protein [Corynebacterium epidermidicanis]AKK03735.1 hypothetical protein CEPID_09450 [Corynebacterium epidermidicanis]